MPAEEPPQIQVFASGIGAGWDRYVEYIHRFADKVQTDCALELTVVPRADKKGEEVTAWVSLDCNGQVTAIVDVEGREPLVQTVRQVLSAEMAARHTFGPWPGMMERDLGKERQVGMDFFFPPR